MAYTVVIVKDSTKLREARVAAKFKAEEAKNPQVLESLTNPVVHGIPQAITTGGAAAEEILPKKKTGFKALFDLNNIKEGFRAVLKERPYHKRTFLILMIIIFEIEIFIIVSSSNMIQT
jgi:hypothetical protein